jgi:CHAT domain-containing protein
MSAKVRPNLPILAGFWGFDRQIAQTLLIVLMTMGLPLNPVLTLSGVAQVQNPAPDQRRLRADQLIQQGIEQYRKSQIEAALQSWQQALVLYQALNDVSNQGAALGNLGLAYNALGDYTKAIQYYQQQLSLVQKSGDRQSEARALGNLGITYLSLGDYPKALEHQRKALTMMRELGNRSEEGQALTQLANVYGELGEYQKSIELHQQSLAIAQSLNDRYAAAVSFNNLGTIFTSLGKNDPASHYYQRSLELAKAIGYRLLEANTLINLGLVQHIQGNIQPAAKFYEQSLAIARQIKAPSTEIAALRGIGLTYDSLKDYAKAAEYHQQCLAIARQTQDKQEEATALNNLGRTALTAGQHQQAETYLRNALQLFDSFRSGLRDLEKISLFDTQVVSYNLLQRILVAQKKSEAALEIAERGRARAFVDLLTLRTSGQLNPQLAVMSPTIQQIQKIAQTQQATLVEYAIMSDEFLVQGKQRGTELDLYIWVIQPNGKVSFRTVDLRPLRQQRTSLKTLVRSTHRSVADIRTSNVKQGLQQLYRLLIEPIADLLPKNPNDRVIFIPHESLFLVPFAALQDASGQYLIEKHTSVTAPAIQVLGITHQQRHKGQRSTQDVLIVGNPTMPIRNGQQLTPLQAAEREAIEIASLFNTKPVTGAQATKAFIQNRMPQSQIVHLATHGFLDGGGKLGIPGEIALAPADGDNGLLTAGEILKLRLQAELVVLSACNTGRGEITGDGVVGLSRSFIAAGVPSIVVSLWSVPDNPTASLMKAFYSNFQQNPDKAQALRQAMLTTMKQHPAPLEWAAFTLIGEAL